LLAVNNWEEIDSLFPCVVPSGEKGGELVFVRGDDWALLTTGGEGGRKKPYWVLY